MRLTALALDELNFRGLTGAAWSRIYNGTAEEWYGDDCGCFDDRCIGFHHDNESDCGCLRVLLESVTYPPGHAPSVDAYGWICQCGAGNWNSKGLRRAAAGYQQHLRLSGLVVAFAW